MELQRDNQGNNIVTYFMWYMCNVWSEEEAEKLFGKELGEHVYEKYVNRVEDFPFYGNLDKYCQNKLVERALEFYGH